MSVSALAFFLTVFEKLYSVHCMPVSTLVFEKLKDMKHLKVTISLTLMC